MSDSKLDTDQLVTSPSGLVLPLKIALPVAVMDSQDRAAFKRVTEMLQKGYGLHIGAFQCTDVKCKGVAVIVSYEEGVGIHVRCAHRDLVIGDAAKVVPQHLVRRRLNAKRFEKQKPCEHCGHIAHVPGECPGRTIDGACDCKMDSTT